MKFFFSKTDSLYKIFKALEKIPPHRDVEIFIDPEHALFDNERRWQQLKEIIEKNHIDATFTTKNKKNKEYYESIGLKINFERKKKIEKIGNMLYLFFFNIKKFHLHAYESKKYIFTIIFIFEILLILWILWFIISLIIPSASIIIQPSEESETIMYNIRYYPYNDPTATNETRFLYVPFYTWSLNYKYDLSISTANIKYITNPSQWKIKIYNSKDVEYDLVKWTQFITSDWLIFRATDNFTLSAGTERLPSQTIITVKADEYDDYWQIIWVRWNIPFKTQMWIKNLNESFLSKDIRAESIEDFGWRESEWIGSVSDEDIKLLKEKLTNEVYEKKMSVVKQNFPISGWFLLPFETITTTTFNNIQIEQSSWDNTPTVKWTAYVTYNYLYTIRDDLYQVFMTYVNERPSKNNQLVKIDLNSVQFLKNSDNTNTDEIKKEWKVYSISTQANIIQTYDFANDPNNILSEIKNKIVWMSVNDARNYILSSYDEIGSVKISVPLRYDSIPTIKSRININFIQ